jgi:hypothetical protein
MQMFYGTEEPVWLVDGATPSPVKYHYLGSAQTTTVSPPRRRTRDPYYAYDDYGDPYYASSRRRDAYYSPPRSRSVRPPSYYNDPLPPPPVTPPLAALSVAPVPYSSANPPPAPAIVPRETPISHTPIVQVVPPTVPLNTPYVRLLAKVCFTPSIWNPLMSRI